MWTARAAMPRLIQQLSKYFLDRVTIFNTHRNMRKHEAVTALTALAQGRRLDAFRLLVQAGPEGLPAGQVAEALDVSPNTLTFHFDRLREAGLVTVRRNGRSMIYSARFETMHALVDYLTETCCQGGAGHCGPAQCRPRQKSAARQRERAS
jgi:ArsR family transcriptional regulator, arsenate/arsenite/antimonite-responsive transcriptional repressor